MNKIQSLLDSTSKRFDEEFLDKNTPSGVNTQDFSNALRLVLGIKSFLLQSNLELLAAVREVAEGMIIKKPQCDCRAYSMGAHNCDFTSNDAIQDVLTTLSEGKEKV